jgi:hypothetical protein
MNERWQHALDGLPVLVLMCSPPFTRHGEVTGVEEGGWVHVVFEGHEEPTRVYWTNVRPA